MKKNIALLLLFVFLFSGAFLYYETEQEQISATKFAEELKALKGDMSLRLIVGSDKKLNLMNAVGIATGPNGTYVLQYDSKKAAQKAYDYYKSLSYVRYVEYDHKEENTLCTAEGYDFKADCPSTVDCNIDDAIKLINKVKGDDLPEIKVAIVDSGVAVTSFTESRFDGGYSYLEGFSSDGTRDARGHGTLVAGTVVQNTLSNVKIRSYQILDQNGDGTYSDAISAIYLAVEDGCRVINCSFAFITQKNTYNPIDDAVDYANERGSIVVAGAGNNSKNLGTIGLSPADSPNAITVGAVDHNRRLASYSNFGEGVDIYTTGSGLTSYDTAGVKTDSFNGTSAASPVISSICTLLLEVNPNITVDEIETLLLETGNATNEDLISDEHRLIADAYGCVKALTNQELERCDLQFEIVGKKITFHSDTEGAEVYYCNNLGGNLQTAFSDYSVYNCYKAELDVPLAAKPNSYVVIACAYAPGKAKSKIELLKIPIYNYENGYLITEAGEIQQYNKFTRCEIVDETVMNVPSEIGGYEVQEIGDLCYMGNQIVEKIVLPDTVKQIDAFAFANCPNLKTVIAPGVEYCGRYAFYNCPNLKNIEMPLVTTANTAMYKNCSNLTCIDGCEFETVCNRAFANCSSIDLSNLNHDYKVACYQHVYHDTSVTISCSKCDNSCIESFSKHIGSNYLPLDLNNDGIVNGRDLAYIKRYCN